MEVLVVVGASFDSGRAVLWLSYALMNHLVTKATITSRLSLTADYLPRVLRKLETGGLIQLDKRSSILLDVQRLASYSSLRAATRLRSAT